MVMTIGGGGGRWVLSPEQIRNLPTPELALVLLSHIARSPDQVNVGSTLMGAYHAYNHLLDVYQVDGGNQPQIGNFAVVNGDANVNRETSIDTDSESSTLTARATQILPE
jgi:hypothetical protein